MQNTSDLYKELLGTDYATEVRLAIGTSDVYATEADIVNMTTTARLFADENPSVGCCVAAEIDVTLIDSGLSIPRAAMLRPYIRLTDGTRHSEWIQKGTFWVDTRKVEEGNSGLKQIVLHGYDAMLKAEQDCPLEIVSGNKTDKVVLHAIADFIGVSVDPRTDAIVTNEYQTELSTEYSCREILGYIAASYCGNFIINDKGELRLVRLNEHPKETNLLISHANEYITFGGVRIIV